MTALVLGVLLFASVHFIPSLAPALKLSWRRRLGENGYRGVFSLLLLSALALIIAGWRSATPVAIYAPPAALHPFALGLLVIAFALLVVGARPSRLRCVVRHPQLTGVALWGLAHLLLNGDSRSVVLFAALTLWAIAEMPAINRREGVWIKGPAPGWGAELLTLCIAAALLALVVVVHPWIAGVPVHW